MRYKKTQVVHQVVRDEEIEDLESIRKLLENICSSYIDISLEYQQPDADITTTWSKVRIDAVEGDEVDIKIFAGKYITKATIKIDRIKFINIVTDRFGILANKSEVTSYDFLDLSENNNENK